MRSLASVQTIVAKYPIENADKIESVRILGWNCVVKKEDNFQVGDKVVYVEVDSIMPDKPEFDFLRDSKGVMKKLRTIRLRGVISQGLVLPLSVLPDGEYAEGQDVTEVLGVTKYEPEVSESLRGKQKTSVKVCFPDWMPHFIRKFMVQYTLPLARFLFNKKMGATFPPFIPKTDETRVQVLQSLLQKHEGVACYVSEKLDGCLHYANLISTDIGYIPIGKIVNQKMNVKILTYNEGNQSLEYKDILEYHKYDSTKRMLNVNVAHRGNGNRPKNITCTDDHKFYTKDGWKCAKDLVVGDNLFHFQHLLQPEAEQLILGTLLGDGSIRSVGNTCVLSVSHSIMQEDYLNYKMSILGKLACPQKGQRGGFPGSKENVRFITAGSVSITNLIKNNCLLDGKKTITKSWVEKLTPIGLAFWYMDDGSIQHRDELKQRPTINISTHSYSYAELLLLQEMLKSKYNINATIHSKKVYKGNILTLDTQGSAIFFSLIAPYVCSSMKYKLPIKYAETVCFFNNFKCRDVDGIVETVILGISDTDIRPGNRNGKYNYDLTIKDNANYFANKVLVHNSSCTVYLNEGEFGVCSRNIDLKEEEGNAFWDTVKAHDIEKKLRRLIKEIKINNVAIQGELIGEGIQGNKYKLRGKDIYFFNVWDIDKREYLSLNDFTSFITLINEKTVPILQTTHALIASSDYYVELAKGKSVLADVHREGIVIRPKETIKDFESRGLTNGRISFKAINPDFLLKYED